MKVKVIGQLILMVVWIANSGFEKVAAILKQLKSLHYKSSP